MKEQEHFFFKKIKVNSIGSMCIFSLIDRILSENHCGYFCLTDVGNVMMAQNNAQLANAINKANLSIADGTPLAWFGKLIGRKKVERISGIDLFQKLIYNQRYKHFLLGDTQATHKKVIEKVKKVAPDSKISCYSPPFKENFTESDNLAMIERIMDERADIIWVSFGGGKQEKWMLQNASKLKRGIMIGVGAALKYYIGEINIPPKLIQKFGLQWITRLKKNPKRWISKGQFKYRIQFLMNFPSEYIKAKFISHS
ncbi:MAG: WecB/TagA/CpsF family glycosyltransferase [Desulfobacteraceae bacterium]|nr:WecB/TagA/CpsF family glycosyltransferase [Desulfobacteraceae bacterium]